MLLLRRVIEKFWELYRQRVSLPPLELTGAARLPIVFFHIPRTGGITFHAILRRIDAPAGVSPHFDSDQFLIDTIAARPDFFRQHSVYSGHFSARILPLVPPGASKLIFLRHPVPLLRSTYHLLRNLPLGKRYSEIDSEGKFAAEFCMANSFEAFIESPDPRLQPHTRSPQTRALGLDGMFDPERTSDPAALARAKAILSSFEFVGITERYSESLRLFQSTYLSTPIRRFYLINASPASLSPAVSEHVQDIVAVICRLDIELYEHACAIFEQQIVQCPGFAGSRRAKPRPLPRHRA